MAKRRMPEIVSKRDRFGKVFVISEYPSYSPRDLGYFKGMSKARPVMVILGSNEDLSLMDKTPESLGMDYPVPVPLIDSPQGAGFFIYIPALRLVTEGCIGSKYQMFIFFGNLSRKHSSSASNCYTE